MQIKKQTDWAIRMLLHLSQHKQAVIGKNLAEYVGMSDKYVPHIMHQLRKAGLVTSCSGVAGGYMLAIHPKQVTLLDVLKATGDYPQISCYSKDEIAGLLYGEHDVLLKNYHYLQRIVRDFLRSITISDLASPDKLEPFFRRIDELCMMLESTDECKMPSKGKHGGGCPSGASPPSSQKSSEQWRVAK